MRERPCCGAEHFQPLAAGNLEPKNLDKAERFFLIKNEFIKNIDMNNKKYNATFVLDTRGYDQPVESLIEKLTGIIAAVGGKVESVENLGVKEFVRTPDRKFVSGVFVSIAFEGPANSASQIKEKLSRDKTVNRILVLAA